MKNERKNVIGKLSPVMETGGWHDRNIVIAFKYIRGVMVWVVLHKGEEDKLGHISRSHRESNLRSKSRTTFLW